MSDLLAGTTITALDTPPTVTNVQTGSYTFTITAWGVATTGGTYVDCGVAFTACTTGRALLRYDAHLLNSTTAGTQIAPVVRTGSTVGSGSTVVAATVDNMIQVQGTSGHRYGGHLLVTGLTAGSAYNVRLEHQVSSASTGTALRRSVTVAPAT